MLTRFESGMMETIEQSTAPITSQPKADRRRFQFGLRGLLLLTTLLSLPLSWAAWQMELRRREQAADAVRQSILAEIATLPPEHAWAGDYYYGDGLGANITVLLAPKAGFYFHWVGCMGLYAQNYGPVEYRNGRLKLVFMLPSDPTFHPIAEELVPIAWGSRHYLITPTEMVGFCNEVNSGREPRNGIHGMYLLRRGDDARAVDGLPTVPAEFTPYLLVRPINATIVAVGKANDKGTFVVLNRGEKHGLLPRMKLHAVEVDFGIPTAEVTQVHDDCSEALVEQVFDDDSAPQIGWRMSTRAHFE